MGLHTGAPAERVKKFRQKRVALATNHANEKLMPESSAIVIGTSSVPRAVVVYAITSWANETPMRNHEAIPIIPQITPLVPNVDFARSRHGLRTERADDGR